MILGPSPYFIVSGPAFQKYLYMKAFVNVRMLKIDKEKAKVNKFPIAILVIQLTTIVLTVYLFYKLIGFEFSLAERTFSVNPSLQPLLVFFFVISAALLVALYFLVKKRVPQLFEAQRMAKSTIKDKAKEKISAAKADARVAALLLIQFTFVMLFVMAVIAWADPQLELIPWSQQGIVSPITTILNGLIAVLVLGIFYYLYSFTAWYRKG